MTLRGCLFRFCHSWTAENGPIFFIFSIFDSGWGGKIKILGIGGADVAAEMSGIHASDVLLVPANEIKMALQVIRECARFENLMSDSQSQPQSQLKRGLQTKFAKLAAAQKEIKSTQQRLLTRNRVIMILKIYIGIHGSK